jgi:DNA-binding MarR family transcriptional regulator
MDLSTSTGYLLQHTASILQRQLDHALQEELSIGMAQFKILMILQDKPGLQQSKLAEYLGQTEASISRQIKLLADRDLLHVTVDPHSRRTHIAAVSSEGAALTREVLAFLKQRFTPVFDTLSHEQQLQLQESLRILHKYACASGKPFACDHPFNI